MQPLLSLIVPIYNVAPYLHECLNSALNQSYKNLEIICMDDGSTDSCPQIIDEYAAKDSRIVVVHKQNEGYGSAVNHGIDIAKGKWIAILEPDDYVVSYMYEELIKIAEEQDVDFVKSNFYEFRGDKDNRKYIFHQTIEDSELYDKVFAPRENLSFIYGFCANWSAVYKKDFLDKYNIRHNTSPGASYQDVGFCFLTNIYASKVYFTHQAFYHYRLDNPNASVNQKDKVYFINKELEFIRNQIENNKYINFSDICDIYVFYKIIHYWSNVMRISNDYKMDFIKCYSDELWVHYKNGELTRDSIELLDERFNLKSLLVYPDKYYEIITNQTLDKSYLADQIKYDREFRKKYCHYFNKIWLYGAGCIGKHVYNALYEIYADKIQGFLISELSGDVDETLFGKPVIKFEKNIIDNETQIILTVSPTKFSIIENKLIENNVKNYFTYNQII